METEQIKELNERIEKLENIVNKFEKIISHLYNEIEQNQKIGDLT